MYRLTHREKKSYIVLSNNNELMIALIGIFPMANNILKKIKYGHYNCNYNYILFFYFKKISKSYRRNDNNHNRNV